MGTGKTYSTKYLLDSNNSSGAAGQVLSTTSTGIDWVDANTIPGIIGGPFLPLTAGSTVPLTGDLYLESSSTDVVMSGNGSGAFTINNTTGQIAFKASGSTVQSMIITSSQISLNEAVTVNSTSLSSPNKLQVNGQARVIGQFMVGDSSASNTAARPIHVKQSGAATIRLEDSDNDNLAFDLIVDEGVGFKIAETIGGDAGDDTRLTIHETSGNVSIGSTTEEGRLLIADSGLGSTDGDSVTNTVMMGGRWDLLFKQIRTANETDWNNTTVRLQGRVDSTNMQSIDFATDDSYNRHIDINTASNSFNTRFTHSGRVGIGTTDPYKKLHVKESASATYAAYIQNTVAGGDYLAMIGDGAGEPYVFQFDSSGTGGEAQMKMYSDGVLKINIMADGDSYFNGGNIGIGTGANIYGDLHLQGGQQDIVLTNDNADGVANLTISRFIGQARGYSNNGSVMQSIDFVTNATTWYKGDIVFRTNNTDGTDTSVAATEKMRIASNGNVGIGFTSPDLSPLSAMKFSVSGNAYVAGNLGIGETSPAVPLHISRDNTGQVENVALLLDNNATEVGTQIGMLFRCMTGGANTDFEIYGEAKAANTMDLVFESDGSVERMRLKADGDLQISRYLEHLGDTNSYLGWSAADDFRIYTGGRELLRLDEGTDPDVLNFMSTNFSMSTGGELKLLNNGGAKIIFGGNGANPTSTEASVYDQSGVGLTLSAHNVSIRNYDGTNMIESARFVHDKLTCAGDVIAYGSPSDVRLKENIKPIESALDKVSKLQGVTFDWKKSDSILNIREDIGFIAQDVQKVLPELVRENSDGMLSMRHQGITPLLLEAIKELQAEIEELKKQIK